MGIRDRRPATACFRRLFLDRSLEGASCRTALKAPLSLREAPSGCCLYFSRPEGRPYASRIKERPLSLRISLRLLRRLVKKCKKPDRKEFLKVARLTAVGFLAVGFLGFFVKLIFIPINQIIVSSQS